MPPYTIDPTVPPNSENPQNGATRIRTAASWLLDVLGLSSIAPQTIVSPPGAQIDINTGLFLLRSLPGAVDLSGSNNGSTTQFTATMSAVYLFNPATFVVTGVFNLGATCTVVGAQIGAVLNGRDQTAAFGNNTFFHLYAIGGGGQTPGLIASLTAPLTGPTLPASYTSATYLATMLTDSSGNLLPMYLRGNTVYYQANQTLLNPGTATTSTLVPISAFVPAIATQYELFVSLTASAYSAAGNIVEYIGLVAGALTNVTAFYQIRSFLTATVGMLSTWLEMPNITGGYYYKLDPISTGATLETYHQIQGYRVPNGST